jgi:hypothetical protein
MARRSHAQALKAAREKGSDLVLAKRSVDAGRGKTHGSPCPLVEYSAHLVSIQTGRWPSMAALVAAATLLFMSALCSLARGQAAPSESSPSPAPPSSPTVPQTSSPGLQSSQISSSAPSTPSPQPGTSPTGWLGFQQVQYGARLASASPAFQGTFENVIIEDTDIGYGFTDHFSADVGLPVIFTRSPFTPVLTHDYYWSALLGEPYVDVKYTNTRHEVIYTSVLTGTIPVGNEDKIYATGRFGVDWFNHIEEPWGHLTPFFNFGASNGAVSRFIMPRPYSTARPYETLGFLGDGEAGLQYNFSKGRAKGMSLGVSAYGLAPAGSQKVYSRIVFPYSSLAGDGRHNRYYDSTFETTSSWVVINSTLQPTVVSNSRLARDNGFSGWLDVKRWHNLDVQLAYTRSMHYDLDVYTATFTFDARDLIRSVVPHRLGRGAGP